MVWEYVNYVLWGIPSFLLLGGTFVYYFQDQLLYYPNVPAGAKLQFLRPKDFEIENFEEVFITTEDKVKIQAWMMFYHDLSSVRGKSTNISKTRPTIIYFHGNAGNISHCLPNVAELMEVLKCNVLLVSYRGYGKSEGYPTEKGIQKDAESVLKYIIEERSAEIDVNKIIVFGRSLGGAVSIYLCSKYQDKVKALIIENTFISIEAMIELVMPLISPLKFLATNKWKSLETISSIKIPILLLAGKKDELVPFSHMKLLQEAVSKNNSNVYFHSFEDGHHMDTWTKPGYYSAVLQFLQTIDLY